jgi:Mycobacterium membrane protein
MRRWALILGLLGLLAGCGGGGDGGDGDDEAGGTSSTEQASEEGSSSTTSSSVTTVPPPPRVVYEILGSGTVPVNYSIAGDRQQSLQVTLPWSEEQAEEPSRLSMLVALTGSQGDVTCRIRRGEEVLAEATLSAAAGPLLACDYPPSGVPQVTFPPGM